MVNVDVTRWGLPSPFYLSYSFSSEDCKEDLSDRVPGREMPRRGRVNEFPEFDISSPNIEPPFALFPGLIIDVLDSVNRWSEAEVKEVDEERKRVLVSYLHWSNKWDEWVHWNEDRLAPIHTHTYHMGGSLKLGQRLEVQDERGDRLEAFVIDERTDKVKVHYKDFATRYDEWIDRTSSRIAPFGSSRKKAAKAGERLSVHWPVPVEVELDRRRQIPEVSDKYRRYTSALASQGLTIVRMEGDGNCLFRSVSHQVYGEDRFHALVRAKCVDYMENDASFFSQFVEGGQESFARYLAAKRLNSCWGDDPEIQAMSEIYQRPIEIWAYDGVQGAKRLRTFHEITDGKDRNAIRLSFYGGGHYDSIVAADHRASLLTTLPGVLEERALTGLKRLNGSTGEEDEDLAQALRESRADVERWGNTDLERCLEQSLTSSDYVFDDSAAVTAAELAETQGSLLDAIAAESEIDFIEREMLASVHNGTELKDDTTVGNGDIERMLRLSELSEEEALALAVQMSLEDPSLATNSFQSSHSRALPVNEERSRQFSDQATMINQVSNYENEEDEELQLAIAASLGKHN